MSGFKEHDYSERRKYKRYKIETSVSTCYLGNFAIHTCVQISEGGMLLQVEEGDFLKHVQLELCFLIPNSVAIIIHGEVMYQMQSEQKQKFVGIRFTDMSTSARNLLKNFIQSLPT